MTRRKERCNDPIRYITLPPQLDQWKFPLDLTNWGKCTLILSSAVQASETAERKVFFLSLSSAVLNLLMLLSVEKKAFYKQLVITHTLEGDNCMVLSNENISCPNLLSQSLNQRKHTPDGTLLYQPCITISWGSSGQICMHAPFPSQLHPSRFHKLSQALSPVDVSLVSSLQGCLFRRQPDRQG